MRVDDCWRRVAVSALPRTILHVLTFLTAWTACLCAPQAPHCRMKSGVYPPPKNRSIPWTIVDLDLPAQQRWTHVVAPLSKEIQAMVDEAVSVLSDVLSKTVVDDLINKINKTADEILPRLPKDYGDEMRGIAGATGIELGTIILYNFFYEIFGMCTSIVAQDSSGHMYHARNLDFGLFLGFDWKHFTWKLTELLRPLIINVRVQKNHQTLYSGTFFAGYIGALTAVRTNAWSISVDTRFDNTYDEYLLKWMRDPTDTDAFLSLTTRATMEDYDSYEKALPVLANTPLVGPAYMIVGGPKPKQGAVISFGPNATLHDVWQIPQALPANSTNKFYVLETNYDHWKPPPSIDDRRLPAEDCMDKLGPANMNFESLYTVLDALPNRNQLTTYTALIDIEKGTLESYLQYCHEIDCSLWTPPQRFKQH